MGQQKRCPRGNPLGILNDIHVEILQGVCGNVLSETDCFSQRFCFLRCNEVQFAVKTFFATSGLEDILSHKSNSRFVAGFVWKCML